MKSRLFSFLLCFVMVTSIFLPVIPESAQANTPVRTPISLDGVPLVMENPIRIINHTTYVPLVDFSSAVSRVSFSRTTGNNSVTVFVPGMRVDAGDGDLYIRANGRYLFAQTGCRMVDNIMYVPLEPLSRAFGMFLDADDVTGELLLYYVHGVIEHGDYFYDEDEVDLLSRIINVESRSEPFTGKIAVGQVIINRTFSSMFPDTIRDVIFDRGHAVQFPPAHTSAFNRVPCNDCVVAAKLALEGTDVVGNSLYFNWRGRNSWAQRNRPYVTTIGNHDFYA